MKNFDSGWLIAGFIYLASVAFSLAEFRHLNACTLCRDCEVPRVPPFYIQLILTFTPCANTINSIVIPILFGVDHLVNISEYGSLGRLFNITDVHK